MILAFEGFAGGCVGGVEEVMPDEEGVIAEATPATFGAGAGGGGGASGIKLVVSCCRGAFGG